MQKIQVGILVVPDADFQRPGFRHLSWFPSTLQDDCILTYSSGHRRHSRRFSVSDELKRIRPVFGGAPGYNPWKLHETSSN